jgi:thiol-disulfide isomerase/thioredoxin
LKTRITALLIVLLMTGPTVGDEFPVVFDDVEIPVLSFPGDGTRRVIWLPSEFGISQRRLDLAGTLSRAGVEVWIPDLHSAWFLPTGRYSLNDTDPEVISAIVAHAHGHDGKTLYLMAEGRSAMLALQAVRHWQSVTDSTQRLAGLLAFSPRLFARTPQGGERAEYLPTARASNIPIYLLQPEESSGFWRIAEDLRVLESGGAPVFLHRLPGVSDGFHVRQDFTAAEQLMTERLPALLAQAMAQLDEFGGTPPEPAAMESAMHSPQRPASQELLRPFPGSRSAPALTLPTLDNRQIDLDSLKGRVVLVNFWATWCPPCVEEIPSLQRLYRRLKPAGLEILAVDVGESAEVMRAFLADKPVDFPVLMDSDAETFRRWGVYAFPTTLVLDREHRIRYAVFGAFEWDSPEVIEALMPLLDAGVR